MSTATTDTSHFPVVNVARAGEPNGQDVAEDRAYGVTLVRFPDGTSKSTFVAFGLSQVHATALAAEIRGALADAHRMGRLNGHGEALSAIRSLT